MNKMSVPSRIIVALASLSLIATYFLPFWFIFLIAPQYPEGLTMNIWLNKLTGQVEIINGLNHYIGMKHIKADMFPEFGYLVYVVGALIVLGLAVAVIGKRKVLFAYLMLLMAGGAAALYDFYKWGYDYGHHLDPKAAIQKPGLYYQPPVIGHKTLLNFDAYSYPDVGGWVVIIAGLALIAVWIFEWYRNKKSQPAVAKYAKPVAIAATVLFSLSSCSINAEPFSYGKDACSFCKMTIVDPHFGAEVLTKKGKVYKFDDMHCLASFLKSGEVKEADVAQTLAVNYQKENDFIDVNKAVFVVSPQLHSPMNGNAAAFASEQEAQAVINAKGGTVQNWTAISSSIH